MTRCLSCLANVINLSLIPVIARHCQVHRVESAWEMSTYGATLDYLRKNVRQVYQSEYFENAMPGATVNGVRNEDVQDLSFPDTSLDLITSNQVFEHVPDDIKGFGECYRVLRPHGALVFNVPLYDIESTIQLATIKGGETVLFAPPEYHDSRHGGPGSALCYWRHSIHDITLRVSAAGFIVKLMKINLSSSLDMPSYVIYATKPG